MTYIQRLQAELKVCTNLNRAAEIRAEIAEEQRWLDAMYDGPPSVDLSRVYAVALPAK